MSKKQHRTRQPQPATGEVTEPIRLTRPVRAPSREAKVKEVNFAQEYHYVIEDLRRIAIFAGGLLVLLIVLAIFLA